MSQRIAYYRVSSAGQSLESQRHVLGGGFDVEFSDVGVSGSVPARERDGFGELFSYIRKGDTLFVCSIDRLGRDALDIQSTVRALLGKGVSVDVHGLGTIAAGVGELILAVLAQIADMERQKIRERTSAGRAKAFELLKETGLTQHGKASMGRPQSVDPSIVRDWRKANTSSIAETALHFSISPATVKRYCAVA